MKGRLPKEAEEKVGQAYKGHPAMLPASQLWLGISSQADPIENNAV